MALAHLNFFTIHTRHGVIASAEEVLNMSADTPAPVAAPVSVSAVFSQEGAKALTVALSNIAQKNIGGLGAKALDLLVDVKVAMKGAAGDITVEMPVEYLPALIDLTIQGIQCGGYRTIFDQLITLYGELKKNLKA